MENDGKDFEGEEFDESLMEEVVETESNITNLNIIEKEKREFNKRLQQNEN